MPGRLGRRRHAFPPKGYGWRGLRSLFGEFDESCSGWPDARPDRRMGAHATASAAPAAADGARAGERCFKCGNCGHMAYPRISPAMMVLIRKGDAVLLAMHVASPTKRFVPLAGFLEAGESIEEAVHREVFEEVGLRCTNLQYFGSQSWPFPHSLMIAFTADYRAARSASTRRNRRSALVRPG
jgi:NAD+ diphosphatase